MKTSTKLLLIIFFVLTGYIQSQAQLGGALERAKQKAREKAEQAANNTLDGKKKNAPADKAPAEEAAEKKTRKISINQTSDFRPGDSVIVNDSFNNDAEGKMPAGWKTNGSGEIITSPDIPGKWLQLKDNSTYKLSKLIRYPAKFTIEFDLLAAGDKIDDLHPVSFGFAADNSVRSYISDAYNDGAVTNVKLMYYNRHGITQASSDTKYNHEADFDLANYANQVMHISIAVDGENQKVYIDNQKISDTKMFKPNRLKYFYLSAPMELKNEARLLFGNYKMTTFKN